MGPAAEAYFNGYALWTYLTSPFLLNLPGVELAEMKPWVETDQVWRVVQYPHRLRSAGLLLRR